MNFLQKGLAGLESRLDKVLLDEGHVTPTTTTTTSSPPAPSLSSSPPAPPLSAAIPGVVDGRRDTGKGGGRVSLQERLAAAAKIEARGRSRSPGTDGEGGVEAPPAPPPVGSVGERADVRSPSPPRPPPIEEREPQAEESEPRPSSDIPPTRTPQPPPPPPPPPPLLPLLPEIVISPRTSLDFPLLQPNGYPHPPPPSSSEETSREDLETTITLLREDLAACELRRQDESHASAERIDALEGKLRYLARESAEAARRRANGAPAGLERKLAEAQEKIALLLEEGEKMSKNELKLQTSIKKFRARTQEEEKAAAEAKRRADKAAKEAAEAKEKFRRAVDNEKRAAERVKGLARLEAEVEVLRIDKGTSAKLVAELREQLASIVARAEDAEGRAQMEALEKERKVTVELKAEVERVQGEAALAGERLESEVRDLKSKMERDSERARIMEEELKGEQAMMESKMEALRARTEEVSSGASGDAYAKLLRQVETLQTQYAIASENWQGIEGSLLSRIANLEKERDDLAKKEGDVRRRARELSLKSKSLEMELETSHSKAKGFEGELTFSKIQSEKLRKELSDEVTQLQQSFEKERDSWQRELSTKLEEERTKWIEAAGTSSQPQQQPALQPPNSSLSIRRTSGPSLSTSESYFLGYNNRRTSRSPAPADPPTPDGLGLAIPPPPRPSSGRGFSTPPNLPIRQDSLPAIIPHPSFNSSRMSLPHFSSTITAEPEESESVDVDYFENIPFTTPSSPYPHSLHHPTRHPDMVSISTVAAGPSVQLVERMSATVRRLESELAAIREEITSVQSQRDDARKEVVEMVREVEEARGRIQRIAELEKEVDELRRREECTLEMLGEKSERVEELRQDVQDLKSMYRDLVSSTVS